MLIKQISAFSNTDGGILICGVSNDKRIVGFDCSEASYRDVSSKIINMGIQPPINCFDENSKNILVIEVPKSLIPITYRGRYYKRVGNTTIEMSSMELRDFFLHGTNWDGHINDYSLNEIDEQTVKKLLREL